MGSQVFCIRTVKSSFLLWGLSKARTKDSDTPKIKPELNVPIATAGKRVPVSWDKRLRRALPLGSHFAKERDGAKSLMPSLFLDMTLMLSGIFSSRGF